MRCIALVIAIATTLALGARENAASASTVALTGTVLNYSDDDPLFGELNDVTIASGTTTVTIQDIVLINDGDGAGGCEVDPLNPMKAACPVPVDLIQVQAFGRDDSVTITGSTRAMVDGGDGSDTLVGGAGPDTLQGGADADFLDGSEGADSMEGGSGSDTASYAGRSDAVTASLDGTQNDGTAGEGDAIAGDVENVVGGDGADTLSGNAGANFLSGGAGEDFLDGGAGQDVLDAGRATDLILLRNGKPDGATSCGSAPDFVIADPGETAGPDCELVDNEPSSRPVAASRIAVSPQGTFGLRMPNSLRFFELRDHVNIPFFSTVDATKAPVRLDAARQERGTASTTGRSVRRWDLRDPAGQRDSSDRPGSQGSRA